MTVIGLDASYTRTGISVATDNVLVAVKSIKFNGIKGKPAKRKKVAERMQYYIDKYKPDVVYIERTRQFSTGDRPFIAMNMIKTGISMQTTIIDVAYRNGLQVFSIDTRSWKSQVVGTSKPQSNKHGIEPAKWPAMKFIMDLGFDVFGDDDAADSGCIALYAFIPEKNKKLKLEE